MMRRILTLALLSVLTGCGVPDLVAHGVKAYEHRQDQTASSPPQSGAPAPSSPAPVTYDEPPPVSAPAPAQQRVTVEPLQD